MFVDSYTNEVNHDLLGYNELPETFEELEFIDSTRSKIDISLQQAGIVPHILSCWDIDSQDGLINTCNLDDMLF